MIADRSKFIDLVLIKGVLIAGLVWGTAITGLIYLISIDFDLGGANLPEYFGGTWLEWIWVPLFVGIATGLFQYAETRSASHEQWAQAEFSDFSRIDPEYLDGLVDEAIQNVGVLFGMAVGAIVLALTIYLEKALASLGIIGADGLQQGGWVIVMLVTVVVCAPIYDRLIRRSIRARMRSKLDVH
jgi:hypothetical protein